MRNVLSSVVIACAVATSASAQTASEHLMLERAAVLRGEVIVNLDDGGGNVRGRLIEIGEAVLELETQTGRRRFDLSRTVRVAQPYEDPVVDGVLRGMATATAWCVLACERTDDGDVHAAAFVSRVGLGGLIGGVIDKRINGRRTLYQRGSSPSVHLGVGRRGGWMRILF